MRLTDYPLLFLPAWFAALWFVAWLGAHRFTAVRARAEELSKSFDLVQTATLTLLALLIGFAFSMAVSRYDQRKNLEEEEANAIGTEWVRADLMPAADAARVRTLLRAYLDQRLLFYTIRDGAELAAMDKRTAELQGDLWSAIRGPASAQPTQIMALVVSGMNDVLNSQGYAQAALLNRIPRAAWILMGVIAIVGTFLVGIGTAKPERSAPILMILPIVLAMSFYLISDIDSPRGGLIRVRPQNLEILAASLRAP
jgi:hypothetical protein